MSNDTVDSIVTSDTNQMIDLANSIILQCNFPNCNISPVTRTKITQSLSTLSQQQATITLNSYAIPTSSVTGRNIFDAYLDLSSAVSSTYIYQCGSNPSTSNTCVNNASNVQNAQENLKTLLNQPVTNQSNYLVGLSLLASVAVVTLMLFLIFMILGISESINSTSDKVTIKSCKASTTVQELKPTIPVANVPESQPVSEPEIAVPVPVSPFESD
jgi:hypothetical protein